MNFEIAPKSTEIQANWYEARLYCFSLNIDGRVGWRLPTKDELNEIYQTENDFVGHFHWSSTEIKGNDAWGQIISSGAQCSNGKNYDSGYVRAIRDLS